MSVLRPLLIKVTHAHMRERGNLMVLYSMSIEVESSSSTHPEFCCGSCWCTVLLKICVIVFFNSYFLNELLQNCFIYCSELTAMN
jgi:hypothetical protein